MNFLALDTSSNACSVALQINETSIHRHVVEPRAHTRILLPMIKALLDEAGLATSDLAAVIIGNGPGSFIGVRIGASVAQGLCFASKIKIVPISSLAIIAAQAFAESAATEVAVAQDARMGEIYLGRFERGPDATPLALGDEKIVAAGKVVLSARSCAIAGAGWQRCDELLAANGSRITEHPGIELPDARYLLPLGIQAFKEKRAVVAECLSPAYLRTKVAEKSAGTN